MRGGGRGERKGRKEPHSYILPPLQTNFLRGPGERVFSSGQGQNGVTKEWAWVVKKGGEVGMETGWG